MERGPSEKPGDKGDQISLASRISGLSDSMRPRQIRSAPTSAIARFMDCGLFAQSPGKNTAQDSQLAASRNLRARFRSRLGRGIMRVVCAAPGTAPIGVPSNLNLAPDSLTRRHNL